MRWDRLFDDLEAQLALDDVRELETEVADRTRRERALIDVQTRLLANVGESHVGLRLPGRVVAGRLVDVGPDWALVETARVAPSWWRSPRSVPRPGSVGERVPRRSWPDGSAWGQPCVPSAGTGRWWRSSTSTVRR